MSTAHRSFSVLGFFLLLFSTVPAGAAVLHVDGSSGTDSGGCGSSGSPCATVQFAVNEASTGDEIRVAGGTYTYAGAGVDPCTQFLSNPAVVCVLNKEVTIRGGFQPPGWGSPTPGVVTILDGQDQRRVVLVQKTNPVEPDTGLELEGVTVRRGSVVGAASGDFEAISAYGGGLIADNSTVVIRDSVFEDNHVVGGATNLDFGGDAAGGAVMLRATDGTVESSTFENNSATGGQGNQRGGYGLGGALGTCCGTVLVGTDLTFDSNTSTGGSTSGSGDFNGSRGDGLGGAVALGVADFLDGTGGSTGTLTRITATNNVAAGGAGTTAGAFSFGGALYVEGKSPDPSSLTVEDSLIQSNRSEGGDSVDGGPAFGGGIGAAGASIVVRRSQILDNVAIGGDGGAGGGDDRGSAQGGGIHIQELETNTSLTAEVTDTIIARNRSQVGATGGNILGGGGGGASFQGNIQATFSHVTLADNELSEDFMFGHAVVLIPFPTGTTLDLDHSIVSDHDTPVGPSALHTLESGGSNTSTMNLDEVLVAGNSDDTNDGGFNAGTFNGLGTISSAGAIGYEVPGTDYHLTDSSPAVDAASGSASTVDFEGQDRDGSPDLGADELGRVSAIFSDGFESGSTSAWGI